MINRIPWYVDREGNEIDALKWDELRCDEAYRLIAEDHVGQARLVTMWLGESFTLAHGEPPANYGTATIKGEKVRELATYENEADAIAGHARELAKLKETVT